MSDKLQRLAYVSKEHQYMYLLTIMYDGYGFNGYSKQANNNTIQDHLEQALQTILNTDVKTLESSRTDAGVHALDQKVMFSSKQQLDCKQVLNSLNKLLDERIVIKSLVPVAKTFHCRYDVVSKTYQYVITTKYSPFRRNYEYLFYQPLDIIKMIAASKYLIGTHDFTSFCGFKALQTNKVRTIYDIKIVSSDYKIYIEITGNGFLYNMVRIIVGTLIAVGTKQIAPDAIADILATKDRKCAKQTVPAAGLYLKKIEY